MKCAGRHSESDIGKWYNTKQSYWSDCRCEHRELQKSEWIV